MKNIIYLFFLAAMFSPAYALEQPAPGAHDYRVRVADFKDGQVYKITGFFGFTATISLNPDEAVVKLVGFDLGWKVEAFAQNKVVIQPKIENADSNLTIITTKRVYYFDLTVRPFPKEKFKSQAKDPEQIYGLMFNYPDDDAKYAALIAARNEVTAKLKAAQDALAVLQAEQARKLEEAKNAPSNNPKNYDYSYQGSESIRPNEVWDDGTFTYFRFFAQQDLPAFFVVNEDGSEAIVNKFIDGEGGDVVVVQRVAKEFVLRLGGVYVCIYNQNPTRLTPSSPTATSSEQIKRVIQGEKP